MFWTNFHSHTHFCDGTEAPEVYLRKADNFNLAAYGFSSHAPTPYPGCKWAMKKEKLPKYLADINNLKGSTAVQVYTSLEIDYVPGIMGPNSDWVKASGLDYTLGSVHFVDFFENGDPWEIDGTHTAFKKGLEDIFKGDVRKAITRYYQLIRQMVREDCPDLIGHLDKIKMQNSRASYFKETEKWYREEVMHTLDTIAQSRALVEVNTRGIYKKHAPDTYPGDWVLKELISQGVPLVLNSDAHHPDEIIAAFPFAARKLKSLGLNQLWAYFDHSWQPFAFDEKGLKI